MGRIDDRLDDLGIVLPDCSVPPAVYSPSVCNGGMVWISGQPPFWNGRLTAIGKVGRDLTAEQGAASARVSALNILSHLRLACGGDLDRVTALIRCVVYVNAASEFDNVHHVANGASQLLAEVFAPLPAPTRSSLGCATLPMNIATEVEASFAISE